MQLPRGTFLTIKRSTKVGDLLAELQDMKFTGICTISFGIVNGTIVYKSGKRILAQYKDTIGDAGWDELQKIIEEKVDASLSTLNEAQIQLSLEFNKTCLIVKGGKTEKTVAVEPVRASELPKIKSDTHLKKAAHKQLAAIRHKSQIYPQISEEKRSEDLTLLQGCSDSSSFDKDIETFETMNVDTITNKIRGECKNLIKQLHLEHLQED